jgi:hypothetical protein
MMMIVIIIVSAYPYTFPAVPERVEKKVEVFAKFI